MITKERYSQLCNILLDEGFDKSYIIDLKDIEEKWKEMLDINMNKSRTANLDLDNLNISFLFSLRWGISAIVTNYNNSEFTHVKMAFHGLFLSISNTILAVIKLAIDGLDYQASVLIRNLYELCFTMLSVIIDPVKRKALVDGSISGNERDTWSKHFRFRKLNETIRNYEKKISLELDSLLYTRRQEFYGAFSSYAHNDFLSFFLYGHALPKRDDDIVRMNLWGNYSSRLDSITGNMNSLLWYTEMVFSRLLVDKEIDLKKEFFCTEKSDKDLWNLASFIGILAKHYYFQIGKEEPYEEDDI